MITSVEIEGLRGIKEGKLDGLTPLVILVGPNGSGKSTILDALYIGANKKPNDALNEIDNRRAEIRDKRGWLIWRAGADGDGAIVVTVSHELPHRIVIPALSVSIGNTGFSNLPSIKLIDNKTSSNQSAMHVLYSQVVRQGKRSEVNKLLKMLIPDLTHLEILTEGNEPILHIVYSDHSVPVALAGDGIQALLRLSLELAVSPGGTVLLEEPEVHQHPAAIRQSARAIQAAVRRGVQVILTTHSLELIDALLAEAETDADIEKMSVYGLKLESGILHSYCLAGSEIEFSRSKIGDDLR